MNPQNARHEIVRHLHELLRQLDAVAILDILLVATVIYYLLAVGQ